MRVVFVPRSVEIKPLFSELKFWVEKVGKTFKRNWNSLSGLFRFLLIFLHSVSVYWWEKESLGSFLCGVRLCIALLPSSGTSRGHALGSIQYRKGRIYRLAATCIRGPAVSLVVVPHSKLVSQSQEA